MCCRHALSLDPSLARQLLQSDLIQMIFLLSKFISSRTHTYLKFIIICHYDHFWKYFFLNVKENILINKMLRWNKLCLRFLFGMPFLIPGLHQLGWIWLSDETCPEVQVTNIQMMCLVDYQNTPRFLHLEPTLVKLHVDFQESIEKSVHRPKHWFSQFEHEIPKSRIIWKYKRAILN